MGAQRLIQQGYGGYAGWGDAEAEADFTATGGGGKWTGGSRSSSSSSSSYDPVAEAKRLNEYYVQQNQPYIQSLEAGIPEVQKSYQSSKEYLTGQVEPLKQRYASLLADMKKSTEIATAREFGRRGISTESGLYDQTLAGTIAPMTERMGLLREQDIQSVLNQVQGLTSAETSHQREIQNAIAQAKAGNPTAAMTSAENLLSLKQSQEQFNAGQELQKFLGTYSSGATNPYVTLGEGQTLYNMLTGQAQYTAPKTYKTSASGFSDPLGLGL